MAKIIFRKIGGRIVPVKIGSEKDWIATANSMGSAVHRKVTATLSDKTRVGVMNLSVPKKGKHVDVLSVTVEKKFRGHGVSRSMFKHAQELVARAGKKFMRSSEIQHVAQIKIRMAASRPGPRGKAGTKFIGTGFGPYGEHNKKIKASVAAQLVKNPGKEGRTVMATSMIPKKLRKK